MKLKILDDSLRDWEQQVWVNFSVKDKEKLVKNISQIWLFGITVMPLIFETEKELMEILLKEWYDQNLYAATMLDKKYIDEMLQLWFKRIILFSSMSDILINIKWLSRDESLKKVVDCCAYAKEKGLDTIFAGEDSTRADKGYLLDVITSIQKYITHFLVCDTVSVLDEKKTDNLISLLKKEVSCDLWVHFHNDRWLANKNAIIAIKAWAELLSWTFWWIWERAWNSDIVDILLALKEKENIVIDWIIYEELETARNNVIKLWWSKAAKPYSEQAFYHESWIHVSALLQDSLSYNSFLPENFWHKNTYFFWKYSGISNYKYLFGDAYSEESLIKIRDYFKELSYERNKSFTEKEVREIIRDIWSSLILEKSSG